MLADWAGGFSQLKMKPSLIFLLRLAWESRIRLPLLIMSGFMAFGLRIQMEINVGRMNRFIPRFRLDEEEFAWTDGEDVDGEDTDDNYDANEYDSSWVRDSNYDTDDYDSYEDVWCPQPTCSPSPRCSSPL